MVVCLCSFMQADLHSDHRSNIWEIQCREAGWQPDRDRVFNPIYARRIGHVSHRCADIAQLHPFLLVTVALLSLRSSSAAVEISLHEFCTIWESLRSCIHVSYICPYRQPCLKPVNFLNSWGCNSKHPKRCTAGRKNAKTCHALLQVTSLLSFGESSEHKLALR